MARAGGKCRTQHPPALLISCGCDLTARMPPRHGGCPGAIPGSRTISFTICDLRLTSLFGERLRVSTRQSLQNSADLGRHQGSLPIRESKITNLKFQRGRGRQVMHLPCKQGDAGALPADSTISPRGTRLKHRTKIQSLRPCFGKNRYTPRTLRLDDVYQLCIRKRQLSHRELQRYGLHNQLEIAKHRAQSFVGHVLAF